MQILSSDELGSSNQRLSHVAWVPMNRSDEQRPVPCMIETEGRNYTPGEYSAWLEEAGFRHIETVWFDAPAANGAVIGRKP